MSEKNVENCAKMRKKLKLPEMSETEILSCDGNKYCYGTPECYKYKELKISALKEAGFKEITKEFMEPPKVDEKVEKACAEQRAKLHMPALNEENEDIRKMACDRRRWCYQVGCPKFPKDLGQGFKSDGTRIIPDDLKDKTHKPKVSKEGINLEVFEPLSDLQPKEKKISKDVEKFLWVQSRVLDKLAFHPEIYYALDSMSTKEILDRLLGKSGLDVVPKQLGGGLDVKPSKETTKLFESLEKQFADEDEKHGKAPPKAEEIDIGLEFTWKNEPWYERKKNGEKKNAKKP